MLTPPGSSKLTKNAAHRRLGTCSVTPTQGEVESAVGHFWANCTILEH